MPSYEELTLRNAGYVPPELQEKIRATRLLVAGCGLGSTIAEAAARVGFERFTLADGDSIAPHNLNRQAFTIMKDGKPCPAPQVAPGAAAVASLAMTAAVRVLAGLSVTAAPRMMVADMCSVCTAPGVDLPG